MLTLRYRGRTWHVRGTVRAGAASRRVPEHSTGTASRPAAEEVAAALEARIRRELLYGPAPVARDSGWAEAALIVAQGALSSADRAILRTLTDGFGHGPLSGIGADAFAAYCRERLPGRSRNTHARHLVVLRRVFRAAGVSAPAIPNPGKSREIVAWLPLEDADRLIRAYSPNARLAARIARYEGLRAGEIARLQWRDVDLARGPYGALYVRETKTGRTRWVWLHPRVSRALRLLRRLRKPDLAERVVLSVRGRAYHDTRLTGGNPFTRAHQTALRRAGLSGFRWHDWRHHWATWALRPPEMGGAGWTLRELQDQGGWATPQMVTRYAAATGDHVAAKLAHVR